MKKYRPLILLFRRQLVRILVVLMFLYSLYIGYRSWDFVRIASQVNTDSLLSSTTQDNYQELLDWVVLRTEKEVVTDISDPFASE